MNNETDPAVLLSQQVFSVYCDQLVLDAVKKNDQLNAQNQKIEEARNMLIHMKIYKGPNEILKINLQQHFANANNKDASHVIYHVHHGTGIEFPYEDIPMLHCKLSNVCLSGGAGDVLSRLCGKNRPKLTVHHGTGNVQLEFYASNDVAMTGTLTNFAGTMQDVQAMIDSNRFITQYSMMGFVDATTGHPVTHDIDNSLNGATFSLETVRIARNIIHPIVLMNDQEGDSCLDDENEEQEDELQVLAKVNKKHVVLFKAAMNHKALTCRNLLLKASRQLLQTITACLGDNTVHFLLEQGSVGHMAHDEDRAAWVIKPPCGTKELTMPISAFSMFQLELVNIPWSRPAGGRGVPLIIQPGFTPNGHIILHYAHDVEAVFCIDAIDLDSLQDGGGLQALLHPLQQVYQRSQISMRLVCIQVHLTTIQRHLQALGIEIHN